MHRSIVALLVLCFSVQASARDPAQVRAFRKAHPCPVTGKRLGACQRAHRPACVL